MKSLRTPMRNLDSPMKIWGLRRKTQGLQSKSGISNKKLGFSGKKMGSLITSFGSPMKIGVGPPPHSDGGSDEMVIGVSDERGSLMVLQWWLFISVLKLDRYLCICINIETELNFLNFGQILSQQSRFKFISFITVSAI